MHYGYTKDIKMMLKDTLGEHQGNLYAQNLHDIELLRKLLHKFVLVIY